MLQNQSPPSSENGAVQPPASHFDFDHYFDSLASKVAQWAGSPWIFSTALFLVGVWALAGPIFHFSSTWQLVINTGTTIVTFLMVFLIQHSQNKDSQAVHLKLDELLRALKGANERLIAAEEMEERQLKELRAVTRHKEEAKEGRNGTAAPASRGPNGADRHDADKPGGRP
ncbi:MAG: low affinity iron permease family protein [Pigmentiphaga sp.]|nr:low affinity iron permease family protein [Pigmentiphaga sp.]